MTAPCLFRSATGEDVPLVLDSWLKSWRRSPWAGCIPNHLYFAATRTCIEGLLARGATVEVAHAVDFPDAVMGWCCREVAGGGETVIHYLYIKDPYLPFGIGEALVARAPGTRPGLYTHRSEHVLRALGGDRAWRHAPEIARRK